MLAASTRLTHHWSTAVDVLCLDGLPGLCNRLIHPPPPPPRNSPVVGKNILGNGVDMLPLQLKMQSMKWNESGFRPPLCTYRLNCARRTSWGWWDDWDDTVLQTQDSKFEPWRSEVEHATSRSRRLPTILTFTHGWGRNIFCFFQTAETGNRTPNSAVKGSGANHYPRAPARRCNQCLSSPKWRFTDLYRAQSLLLRTINPRPDVNPSGPLASLYLYPLKRWIFFI